MEAGGAAGGRGAVASVGVGGAVAGAAPGIDRLFARLYLVLGLAGVAFAIWLAVLHPWVSMPTHGLLLLLLSAGAHASAAVVATFATDARRLQLAMNLHVLGCPTFTAAYIVGSWAGNLHIYWAEFMADDMLCRSATSSSAASPDSWRRPSPLILRMDPCYGR